MLLPTNPVVPVNQLGSIVHKDNSKIEPANTVVHIVLLEFADGIKTEAIRPLCDAFVKLKDTCIHPNTKKPYINSLKGGYDNSIESLTHGYTHAFVLEFSNLGDRDYYVNTDPSHQSFKKLLKDGGLANVTVIDFTNGVY
ncbi:hypothetical protein TWF694_011079 [Orbilia ellipsospora]|uniref:Stress-response A/B barrel domain-containing protein n=1 Tax=Orbilia ellipsospora TaxID=2528407 RepID=A0AAV9X940_9PEZI